MDLQCNAADAFKPEGLTPDPPNSGDERNLKIGLHEAYVLKNDVVALNDTVYTIENGNITGEWKNTARDRKITV